MTGPTAQHCRVYFYPRSPCGERLYRVPGTMQWAYYFYPRSPCGERPAVIRNKTAFSVFLSTLSLRRATVCFAGAASAPYKFLSTLSLRRATGGGVLFCAPGHISIHALLAESDMGRCPHSPLVWHFYPRSPCGERRFPTFIIYSIIDISIHALLAESDALEEGASVDMYISIHALLAESDHIPKAHGRAFAISIHALLAESD